MRYTWALVLGVGLGGCGGCKDPAAKPDAAIDLDAPADAELDAAIDAAVDAPADVALDAPSGQPRCAAAPQIALDVSPLRITSIAASGSTLYVAAYNDQTQTDATLFTYDMVTRTQSAAPLSTTGVLQVWPTDGDVFASESGADGAIWRLHPGSAPAPVVQHRPDPRAVTSDGTYVYWSERDAGAPNQDRVLRRLITGGAVEPVMTCDAKWLVVVPPVLYCAPSQYVERHAVDGSGVTSSISFPGSQLVYSLARDGSNVYFAQFGGLSDNLFRVDNNTTTATLVAPVMGTRIAALTASTEYIYAMDIGFAIRRIHKTTGANELVYGLTTNQPVANHTAVVWNNQLYFDAQDYNAGGAPYVMRCVD